ncbi:MAG: tRNA (guanosine(46)-N7)-methyltransferase TrmB, partial [Alphaproteobacteria bacterium]|nr:tRNA (guanosine(46)-N7)-methyltransferase TrmB [Alphaproteobacteria bacterium]
MTPCEKSGLEHKRVLYGRRRGRPLRLGQRELFATLLPRVRVTLPEQGPLDPYRLFDPAPRDVWIEIGFGSGEHLAQQAASRPEIGMIGCEVFENGVVKLLGEIHRRALRNVRVLPDDARPLLAMLPPASIGRVFILFPDPWPKLRHHKRRLVATATLDMLAEIMKDGAELRIATDHAEYFEWMLDVVTPHPGFEGLVRGPSGWVARPADWPPTRYEGKA